jgi:Short C-terminal domain/Phospholipase_D-nuclease N-terminal
MSGQGRRLLVARAPSRVTNDGPGSRDPPSLRVRRERLGLARLKIKPALGGGTALGTPVSADVPGRIVLSHMEGCEMDYPLLNAFLTMLWFFLWILWIWLVFMIIFDIFRSNDLGGWAKAGWVIFVIIVPLIGVLVYLIARGGKMQERRVREAQANDQAFRAYVRDAAGNGSSHADQLAKLADLHERGVITDAEFEQGKAKVLS